MKKSKDTGSYEDFIECLKLYDKMENGTMMLGELEHILLSLGEKLGEFNIKGTLPPDFLFYTYCRRTFPTGYIAKTQYRKFKTNIPRKGTVRLQSQILHSCFCEPFIYSSDRSAYSAAGKYVGRTWENINRSQTHECGNWNRGRANPFLGIHKFKFLCCVYFLVQKKLFFW